MLEEIKKKIDITEILEYAIKVGASDLHFSVGTEPVLRINGNLVRWKKDSENCKALSPHDTLIASQEIMNQEQLQLLENKGEVDFSYSLSGMGRFRVNAYRQRGCVSLALRTVPYAIPPLESLGLAPVVTKLSGYCQGLILVTGPTGSGRSTTLAALIDKINREKSAYIITIEDPIEYLHQHQQSIVDQRELGIDTFSMAGALRASLRQDPDALLVSEMHDIETISLAISAAETGQLVLGALYTNSVVQTIDRIIEIYPSVQQEQIKVQLAANLQGVVSQQLLPHADGNGRVLACEVLTMTPAVRNLIREGKTQQLSTLMLTGKRWGMQTLEMSLADLVRKKQITKEIAMKYAHDQESLHRCLSGTVY